MTFIPAIARGRRFDTPIFVVILLVHLGALAAPFTFSWTGLVVAVALYYVTGALGVTLCYHRYLTHKSFKCPRSIEFLITLFGCFAMQGGPITWVANHRLHHKESDHEPDPHSPVIVDFLWGHVLWLFWKHPKFPDRQAELSYCRDLERSGVAMFLQRMFVPVNIVMGVGLFLTGWAIAGAAFGWSLFVWGFCVRTVVVWHITWTVNSVTHLWGYTNYETTDNSKNNWLIGLLAFGEGWHNNHHADQRSAAHGHRWFEFDATYLTIRAMEFLGLAWDVVEPRHRQKIELPKAA